MFFLMFKIKYLINKMKFNILSQHVWWLDGKGVSLHFRYQSIKPRKCVYGQQ